jgi:ABC-type uncharacterized transport system permease subunit
MESSLVRTLRLPVITAFAGVVIAVLVLALSGVNPLIALGALINGSLAPNNLPDTINWAVPLVGMTLVAAIPLRAGIINLGGDGQLVVGALAAALTAIYLPLPAPLAMIAAILVGALAGGLFALLAAWGETRFNVPLLISSLLLSYPAAGIASYLVAGPIGDARSGLAQTVQIPEGARLMEIAGVNGGVVLVILICALAIFVDRRTVFGLETQVRGENRLFASYVGVNAPKQTLQLMFFAGAIAGVVGSILVLGSFYRFIDNALLSPGYTWSGLMAALIGKGAPVASIVTGLFFAALQTGGFAMQRETSVPRVFTAMMQAVIVLVLTLRIGRKGGRYD